MVCGPVGFLVVLVFVFDFVLSFVVVFVFVIFDFVGVLLLVGVLVVGGCSIYFLPAC